MTAGAPRFCDDAALGYRREAWRPEPGAGLTFDEGYRLAHLPLVAADHPLAIAEIEGRSYRMGRHPPTMSLVLEVDGAALRSAPAFVALMQAVAGSRFGGKVAWSCVARRWGKLHATLAGRLTERDLRRLTEGPGRLALEGVGPLAVALRGLFAGRINRGRLYLRAYPESRDGRTAFAAVAEVLERPPVDLVLVGLFNLVEELDAAEADALQFMIAAWWERTLLVVQASRLAVLSSRDDLVLESRIVATVALDAGRR